MTDRSPSGRSQARPGAVLKSLRNQRGWTLSEVSRRTGLPVSTLSKVENDKMSLTYDKLTRISEGLEIDIARLFGGAGAPDEVEEAQSGVSGRRSITRAGEGKAIETKAYGHLYPAADLLNKRIIPIVAEVRARSVEEFGELVRHPGEEYAYVIEGEVELHTSLYAPVHLKTGDSIYFDSGMGHAYIAVGSGPCRVLSICSGAESQLIAASGGRTGDDAASAPDFERKTRRQAG
jgi:transcriptional regulator with XRE-family HTH domain